MVEKEGTEGEEQAKRAYQAARTDIDDAAEMAIEDKVEDKVSSALINRVTTYARILSFISSMFCTLISCN